MTTQSVELRLADDLEKHVGGNIAFRSAAELRRLHEENTALRQAIEQAEKQEPVAWIYEGNLHIFNPTDWAIEPESVQPLYTAPPRKEWVGLTDEEIAQTVGSPIDEVYLADFHRVIEKLRSKNT
jgi:hypothetical protein